MQVYVDGPDRVCMGTHSDTNLDKYNECRSSLGADALIFSMKIAGAVGALILLYAVVKGAHDALHIGEACAIMRVARSSLNDNKAKILKLWIPCKYNHVSVGSFAFATATHYMPFCAAILLNLIVCELWAVLAVPISGMTSCDDLCSSIPSFTKILAPGFWFISNQWTSNFVTYVD